MILDIIIILIFLISTLRGQATGFGDSVIRLLRLALSIAGGIILTPTIVSTLKLTNLDEYISAKIYDKFAGGIIDLFDFVPGTLGEKTKEIGEDLLEINIGNFTNTCIQVLAFAIVVIVISLFASMLRSSLRRERKKGSLVGTVDSSIGFIVGMAKGVILVFLFLAFMFPFAGVFMPEKIHAINESLNHSFIAGPLYDINPLVLLIKKIPF